MERVVWRSKQALDFSFLMMYAQSRGTFYLQVGAGNQTSIKQKFSEALLHQKEQFFETSQFLTVKSLNIATF